MRKNLFTATEQDLFASSTTSGPFYYILYMNGSESRLDVLPRALRFFALA
jgi:hypothetical protein